MENIYTDFVSFFSNFVWTYKTSFQVQANGDILILPLFKRTRDINQKADQKSTQLFVSTIFSPLILSCGPECQSICSFRYCLI